MPLIVAALVLLAVLALSIVLLPVSILQRYRVGTRRRLARGWITRLNLAGITLSACLLLVSSALISPWLPGAFTHAALGFAAGCAMGAVGLLLTRWETTPGGLYYTPPWMLVLGITLVITGRLLFGFWRGWNTWSAAPDASSWLQQAGATGSLAAGAAVLGYYALYWAGVRRKLKRQPPVSRIRRR